MKKKYFLKIIHVIALVLGIVFLYQGVKVYSQGIDIKYSEAVDKKVTSVHNFRDYVELTRKDTQGVTGYIIYLNRNEDVINAIPELERLAQGGYNVYIIKNKKFSDLEKLKIGKNIVENSEENVNWIINYRDGENYSFELKEWMINKGYKAGVIQNYFNSFEDMTKNKSFEEINNELNIIRNKI